MTRLEASILAMLVSLGTTTPCFAAPKETARVRIHAVDPFGKGLGPVKVIQFVEPRVGGADYSSRFTAGDAEKIPFGDYVVSVRAGGIEVGGSVAVYAGEVFVVLSGSGWFVDYAPGFSATLRGNVTGIPEESGAPIWIRIFNLYQDIDCCRTIQVKDDGSFLTGGLEAGEYIVTILHDGGVIYNGMLRLEDPNSEVEIDVGTSVVKAHAVPRQRSAGR